MNVKERTAGPVAIRTKYPVNCDQTGALIEKGALCIWYPVTDKTFHVKSPVGQEFISNSRGEK